MVEVYLIVGKELLDRPDGLPSGLDGCLLVTRAFVPIHKSCVEIVQLLARERSSKAGDGEGK